MISVIQTSPEGDGRIELPRLIFHIKASSNFA
uniref:Uncharacterized protein n=1 Tax=Siphoviridae sp. ctLqe90 TaxID=2825456 RepID=A0A8S5Q2V2_9CAUD|nr:MAG TPA: hypothetical protein [Siphoviridae sp. ctLqe90]